MTVSGIENYFETCNIIIPFGLGKLNYYHKFYIRSWYAASSFTSMHNVGGWAYNKPSVVMEICRAVLSVTQGNSLYSLGQFVRLDKISAELAK